MNGGLGIIQEEEKEDGKYFRRTTGWGGKLGMERCLAGIS